MLRIPARDLTAGAVLAAHPDKPTVKSVEVLPRVSKPGEEFALIVLDDGTVMQRDADAPLFVAPQRVTQAVEVPWAVDPANPAAIG